MTDKPKQTVGTRRGNGAGWGGLKKGWGNGSAKQDFSVATNQQGHNGATPVAQGNRQALRREQAEGLMDTLLGIALDEDRGPTQVKAIEAFQNRVWGTPRQTVALEGDADKPLAFVIMGVPEKESTDAWTLEHSPADA